LPRLLRAVAPHSPDFVVAALDVALTDLRYYRASGDMMIAGKEYKAGKAISCKLDLWGWHAAVEGKLMQINAQVPVGLGFLTGSMDPIVISAGGVTFLSLTSADGRGGATLDIGFQPEHLGARISGRLALVDGRIGTSVDVAVQASGFDVTIDA